MNVQGIKSPDVMIGPDDANADFKNTVRERNARQVLDDSLAGLQSLGRKTPAIRDGRDSVGGGLDTAPRTGTGPKSVFAPLYKDTGAGLSPNQNSTTQPSLLELQANNETIDSDGEKPLTFAPKVTSDDRRASRTGDGRSSDERYNPFEGLFQTGSGSKQTRRGGIVTNQGVLDNNPNEDGGIKSAPLAGNMQDLSLIHI